MWYPIMLDLHRFMIAVARVSVNHDGKGGTAPDPPGFGSGGQAYRFVSLLYKVNVDLASLPGPPGFLNNCLGSGFMLVALLDADIAAWPYSVGIFVRFHCLS